MCCGSIIDTDPNQHHATQKKAFDLLMFKVFACLTTAGGTEIFEAIFSRLLGSKVNKVSRYHEKKHLAHGEENMDNYQSWKCCQTWELSCRFVCSGKRPDRTNVSIYPTLLLAQWNEIHPHLGLREYNSKKIQHVMSLGFSQSEAEQWEHLTSQPSGSSGSSGGSSGSSGGGGSLLAGTKKSSLKSTNPFGLTSVVPKPPPKAPPKAPPTAPPRNKNKRSNRGRRKRNKSETDAASSKSKRRSRSSSSSKTVSTRDQSLVSVVPDDMEEEYFFAT